MPAAMAAQSCETAGALRGSFDGDAQGPITLLVSADGGSVEAMAKDGEIVLSGDQQVSQSLTTVSGSAGTGASFQGQFDSPGAFSGTWNAGGASGTITATRLGGASNPTARLTGDVFGAAEGLIAIDLDASGAVTGVVLTPAGEQLDTIASGAFSGDSLTATTGRGAELNATIDRATGSFSGNWSFGSLGGDIVGSTCQVDDADSEPAARVVEITADNGATVARSAGTGMVSLGGSGARQTQSQVIGSDSGGATTTSDFTTSATTTTACDPGSQTLTENDGGTPGELDQGDEWTADWDQCSFSASSGAFSFESVIDGGIEYAVTECTDCARAGDDSVAWAYGIDISYDAWSVRLVQNGSTTVDLAIDGEMSLGAANRPGLNETTFTISGGPMSFNDRADNEAFGFRSIDYTFVTNTRTGDYTLTANSTTFNDNSIGGEVTVETQAGDPLAGNGSQPPTSGVLIITGANGSQAIMDAGACGDDAFDLTVNGAGQGCNDWAEA